MDRGGIAFVASDQTSGRLIHIFLSREDMLEFRVMQESLPFRCTLETGSIHNQSAAFACDRPHPASAVFHQLKRRDNVVVYANASGHVGSLVDYSGKR